MFLHIDSSHTFSLYVILPHYSSLINLQPYTQHQTHQATIKAFQQRFNFFLSISTVSKHSHTTLSTASNLANLLPTGTVLIFQALLPSFSNNGNCSLALKYLTLGLIFICSLACFLSSFTDSFVHDDGKFYYGIATRSGLYIFNDDLHDGLDLSNDETMRKKLKA
ncbi:hypothetical protein SLA2020_125920 [Shorea laevis]